MSLQVNRREFLRSCLLGACAVAAQTSAAPRLCIAVDQVIFDARRHHALAFAQAAQLHGVRTRAMRADFWQWRLQPVPIAGLTDFRTLCLLRMMAADCGLHPVLQIYHDTQRGAPAHRAFGRPAYRKMSDLTLAHGAENWAAASARLALNLPAGEQASSHGRTDFGAANLPSLPSSSLVTWVMA